MNWMRSIAEEKIREAIRNGELDQLPGSGKPLELDDDSMVPEDLRASYRVMKNAGMIPEEMQLRKDMLSLEQMIACCTDSREKSRLQTEWSAKRLRVQRLMAERGMSGTAAFADYQSKLNRKLLDDDSDER